MKKKFRLNLEKIKKLDRTYLLLAALVGILLLVIAIPTGGQKEQAEERQSQTQVSVTETASGGEESYRRSLERQLEQVLSAMEGVGKVEVMITLQDAGAAVVEKDLTRTQEKTTEADGAGASRENTVKNEQETTIYTRDRDDNEIPFVSREVYPQVEGVRVVAEGAGSSVVIKNFSDAILALFPVEAHKIKVVKMN